MCEIECCDVADVLSFRSCLGRSLHEGTPSQGVPRFARASRFTTVIPLALFMSRSLITVSLSHKSQRLLHKVL